MLEEPRLTTHQLEEHLIVHWVISWAMTTTQRYTGHAKGLILLIYGTQTDLPKDSMGQALIIMRRHFFSERLMSVINNHDLSTPLFLYYAPHIAHCPLEVPDRYAQKFSFIDEQDRQYYHAMIEYLDEVVGNLTKALKIVAFGIIYFLSLALIMVVQWILL